QLDARRSTCEQRKDVAFAVADHDQLAGACGPFGNHLRRAQPALRFLFRQRALAPRAGPLADLARPNRRVQQTDNGFVLTINSDYRMHEKTRCLAIAGRTQPATRPMATAEIDLGGVL